MPRYLIVRTWVMDAASNFSALKEAMNGNHLEVTIRQVPDDYQLPFPEKEKWLGEPSARQIQVLKLMAAGRTTAQVSEELGIGKNTIQRHMDNLARTMQLPSARRALVIQEARNAGLI